MKWQINKTGALLDYQEFIKALDLSINSNGMAKQQVQMQLDTIYRKVQTLRTELERMATGDGGMKNFIKTLLEGVTELIKFLDRVPSGTYNVLLLVGAIKVLSSSTMVVNALTSAWNMLTGATVLNQTSTTLATAKQAALNAMQTEGVIVTRVLTAATAGLSVVVNSLGGWFNFLINAVLLGTVAYGAYTASTNSATSATQGMNTALDDLNKKYQIAQAELEAYDNNAKYIDTLTGALRTLDEQINNTSDIEKRNKMLEEQGETERTLSSIVGQASVDNMKAANYNIDAVNKEKDAYMLTKESKAQSLAEIRRQIFITAQQVANNTQDQIDAIKNEAIAFDKAADAVGEALGKISQYLYQYYHWKGTFFNWVADSLQKQLDENGFIATVLIGDKTISSTIDMFRNGAQDANSNAQGYADAAIKSLTNKKLEALKAINNGNGVHDLLSGNTGNTGTVGDTSKPKSGTNGLPPTSPATQQMKYAIEDFTKGIVAALNENKKVFETQLNFIKTYGEIFGKNTADTILKTERLNRERLAQLDAEYQYIQNAKSQIKDEAKKKGLGELKDSGYYALVSDSNLVSKIENSGRNYIGVNNYGDNRADASKVVCGQLVVKSWEGAGVDKLVKEQGKSWFTKNEMSWIPDLVNKSMELGAYYPVDSGYKPQPGDAIIVGADLHHAALINSKGGVINASSPERGVYESNRPWQQQYPDAVGFISVKTLTGNSMIAHNLNTAGLKESLTPEEYRILSKDQQRAYKFEVREQKQEDAYKQKLQQSLGSLDKQGVDNRKDRDTLYYQMLEKDLSGLHDPEAIYNRKLSEINNIEKQKLIQVNPQLANAKDIEAQIKLNAEQDRHNEYVAEGIRLEADRLKLINDLNNKIAIYKADIISYQDKLKKTDLTEEERNKVTKNLELAQVALKDAYKGTTAEIEKNKAAINNNKTVQLESARKIIDLEYEKTKAVREGTEEVLSSVLLHGQSLRDVWKKLWLDLADEALRQLMRVNNSSRSLLGSVFGLFGGGGGNFGGFTSSITGQSFGNTPNTFNYTPKIPAKAQGDILTSPQVVLAGEAGDEAIIPIENNQDRGRQLWYEAGKRLGTIGTQIAPNFRNKDLMRAPAVSVEVKQNQDNISELRRQNELMMQQNQMLMNMVKNNGNTNITIHAIDSRSIQQMIKENGEAFVNVLRQQGYLRNK